MGKILFLDDMNHRHLEFDRYARGLDHTVVHVETAAEAIRELDSGGYDQVFLDHDLSEDDIMVRVGDESKVPTGMDVVDHILTMASPPPDVIVHSCNGPASLVMAERLESINPPIRVRRIAFPDLVRRLRAAQS